MMLDAYEHQNFTLAALVRRLNLPTDPSRPPLVSIMFNLGHLPRTGFTIARKAFNFFDLNLDAHDSGQDLRLVCRYNTGLYDQGRMERMMGHLRTLLEAAASQPSLRVSELPLLTEAERRQLLVEWNPDPVEPCLDGCVHQRFEEQAERTPDAVAVVFENEKLTYRELNDRPSLTSTLAHSQAEGSVRRGFNDGKGVSPGCEASGPPYPGGPGAGGQRHGLCGFLPTPFLRTERSLSPESVY